MGWVQCPKCKMTYNNANGGQCKNPDCGRVPELVTSEVTPYVAPEKKEIELPDKIVHAFRGEDAAKNGKSGRTPQQLKEHHGFAPWQIASVAKAREELTRLVNEGKLADEARLWCLEKDRKNGWFFSTGTDVGTAYDNYDFFYRITVSLTQRTWNSAGLNDAPDMYLYTNNADREFVHASEIAVIWKTRPTELLIMTPVPIVKIAKKKSGKLPIYEMTW